MALQIIFDATTATQDELASLSALIDHMRGIKPRYEALAPDGYADGTKGPPLTTPGYVGAPPPPPVAASAPVPPAPPAPAAAAPPPPASSIAAAASDGERDNTGLPWDARIHTSGDNKKNADGSWRKRRGVDDATLQAVTAELRGLPGAPVPPPPPSAAPAPMASEAVAVTTAASPAPPPPPAAPAAPAAGPTRSVQYGLTFQEVMAKATNRGMNYEQLHALANQYFSVAKASDLIKTPENWDLFADLIEAWEA